MTDESQARPPEIGDEELVRRYISGDEPEKAFQELFGRYGTLTYAFFRRRIGNEAVAAEQNQELYLSVVAHLDGFRGECSFRSWLFNLAHNRLMQLRRRLRVHVDETPEEIPETVLERIAGAAGDQPEMEVSRSEQTRMLWACMARLSEVERAVVCGRYFEETTLKELTSILGLDNRSGARASLIAAQRKLKRCMELSGVTGVDAG